MLYEIVSAADHEQLFWNHVNQDPIDYYFFILDWTRNRQDTKILLALKNDVINGLALEYADRVVQLRGSQDAVRELLDNVDLEGVDLQVPLDYADMIQTRYMARSEAEITLMQVTRGEEKIAIKHDVGRMLPSDAEEIAETMKRCDPVWWGDTDAENIRKSLETNLFFGIRQGGKIASFGSAHQTDTSCSNVSVIATRAGFRNRGYATSVTSFLVNEILKLHQTAIIHVLSKNVPAVKVYLKVGFKPYKRYRLMHLKKR
jgi:ribosomal protein S18 acetylase RimI-like enzyme